MLLLTTLSVGFDLFHGVGAVGDDGFAAEVVLLGGADVGVAELVGGVPVVLALAFHLGGHGFASGDVAGDVGVAGVVVGGAEVSGGVVQVPQ